MNEMDLKVPPGGFRGKISAGGLDYF
jgi:hypothetical protein